MRFIFLISIFFFTKNLNAQHINVNNNYNYTLIRNSILSGDLTTSYSLNIRPISYSEFDSIFPNQNKLIYKSNDNKFLLKSLGIDYFIEYNSNHPYNRNNGTMIPNKGYQHILSPGLYFKIGPLSIQLKPEHHYAVNHPFVGFWEGHYPEIWKERYKLWNKIDMPERHGNKRHNKMVFGQSNIKLNWKNISLGLSSENIWWGPSKRNSIMMSNNAQGFNHITLNTNKPIKTIIGNFEWQIITGKLENSGYDPPKTDFEYAGTKLFVPKINQIGETDDWRYLQGFIISYSPKWIDGLSFGLIRWVQMYSALIDGKYTWLNGKINYLPAFSNLFRSNDKYIDFETQTNQAAGIFLKWLWKDSNAEFYFEFHHNDSKQNLRDLLLDSDHSRAATVGLSKLFRVNDNQYAFNWEWTQMEQSASRLIRNAGSWYEHSYVYDGYTHKGEVLGSSIGPGSNSHYISVNKLNKKSLVGLGIEIVDNDNDFYHVAFSSAKDFRRYWKDFNLHINFHKKFRNFNFSSNIVFIRSLNYQWELEDNYQPYYHPGNDVSNFHLSVKLTYFGNW
ncbi:MAG: capsule assembly Wzi family protein [Flavobacteriaceae bacterium]